MEDTNEKYEPIPVAGGITVLIVYAGLASLLHYVDLGFDREICNMLALLAVIGQWNFFGMLSFHPRTNILLKLLMVPVYLAGMVGLGFVAINHMNGLYELEHYNVVYGLHLLVVATAVISFVVMAITAKNEEYFSGLMWGLPYFAVLIAIGLIIGHKIISDDEIRSSRYLSNFEKNEDAEFYIAEREREEAARRENEENKRRRQEIGDLNYNIKMTTYTYNDGVNDYNRGNYRQAANEFYEAYTKYKSCGLDSDADEAYENYKKAQEADRY